MRVEMFRAHERGELRRLTQETLDGFRDLFPADRGARLLVKPNLNSNLDSLTGNTTDLRVLADVVEYFKEAGYTRITIAEGYNGGFHRDGVDVIARNRVDRLAAHFGVDVKDMNFAQGQPLELEGGLTAAVAKICYEADFFVNIPKLKTHYNTLMTVCLKSLMGVLVGRENKALAHESLIENILRINDAVRPDIHVVDAMVAMEGTGPSAGTPLRMDTVFVGDDPYVTDLVAARLFSCTYDEIPLLREAIRSGRVKPEMVTYADSLDLEGIAVKARHPNPNFVARLTIDPRFERKIRAIRNAPVIRQIINHQLTKKVLLRLGITQEIIVQQERENTVHWRADKCRSCGKCAFYCPLHFDLPREFCDPATMNKCLDCLYCYAVCSADAIEVEGDLGFYAEQERRFGKLIKSQL